MATASVAIHLSEVSFRAALAALKISKTFSRQVQSPSAAYQAVLNHLDRAGLFRSLSLHVAANGEGSTEWSFGNPSELSVPSLVAAHSNSSVVVNAAAEPATTGNTELLRLTLDYLVQQTAMFATREWLQTANRNLQLQLRITEESLNLRKRMDRAKALIVSRRGLTAQQAQEFLVASSVRTGKPLLKVAEEMILALSDSLDGLEVATPVGLIRRLPNPEVRRPFPGRALGRRSKR